MNVSQDNRSPKLPPQDIEAEKSVLGAVLLDPEAIIKVAELITPAHFYYPQHQAIYEAITALYTDRSAIDVVTISNYLKKQKKLKTVGGLSYLSELASFVPTATNIEDYAQIVKETGVRRRLISVSNKINNLAYQEEKKLDLILNEAEKDLFQISEDSVKRDFVHISTILEEAYERAEELGKDKSKIRGIPTGFSSLDNMLGGFQDSDLVILAARPSVGKSSLAFDFARHIATMEGRSVGIFSLEMSNMQVSDRLLAMQLGANLWDLRMGNMSDELFMKYGEAMGILSESNIYVDDTPGMHIAEMRTKARRMKIESNIDILIVDYLQLIHGSRLESRVQEVSEISQSLKNIARELDVPVIALSQLSRAVESRSDRIPQLSDLRDSGSIEQDADVVMFIHREEQYNPDTDRKGLAEIYISKHRNGSTGKVDLAFVKEQARFRELAHGVVPEEEY